MTHYETQARSMMQRIRYLTIASVSAAGEPWNSPVYSSFDSDGNFYWTSSPQSRHSLNIAETRNIALVIYDSTVPEGTGVGALYIAIPNAAWVNICEDNIDGRTSVSLDALRNNVNW